MKHNILLINLLLFVLSFSAKGQEVLYIFENTGKMDAFYCSDIDSITHSKIGIDGKNYDDYVTQLVHLKDSVYQINIADIDSITLRKPETIVKPDVYFLTEAHLPYIERSEAWSLFFKESLPQNLRPKVGQMIVLKPFMSELVEYGFMGKVESISTSAGDIEFHCSEVGIDDIYEQIIEFGTTEITPNGSLRATSADYSWKIPININIVDGIKLTADFSGKVETTQYVRKLANDKITYVKVDIINSKALSVNVFVENKTGMNDLIGPVIPVCKIPIGTTPIFLEINFTGFYDLQGSVSFGLEYKNETKDKISIEYANNDWSINNSSQEISSQSTESQSSIHPKLSFKGSFHVGIYGDFYVGAPNSSLGVGVGLYIGPKFKAQLEMIDFESPSVYSVFKNAEIGVNWLSIKGEVDFRAKIPFFKEWKWKALTTPEINFFPWTFHLMPAFANFKYNKEGNNSVLSYDVSRHLLYPVHLGTRVYDNEKKNLIQEQYRNDLYWYTPIADVKYNYTLTSGQSYKAVPSFKYLGIDVPINAEPELEINDLPASLISVTQDSYFYNSNGYELQSGLKSNFKVSAYVNTKLSECLGQIQEWGIAYYLPDNQKQKIPIQRFDAGSYSVGLTIPSNSPETPMTVGIYVVYANGKEEFGDPVSYTLKYPEQIVVNMTGASFKGNASDITFNGVNYKHRSSFLYNFSIQGAYWLTKQGAMEKGNGWSNWNVGTQMINPCDGNINLTVNYHYDNKTFTDDYRVVAYGLNKNGFAHESTQYASLSHDNEVFTGCVFSAQTPSRTTLDDSKNKYIVVDELFFDFIDLDDLENYYIINVN